MIGRPDTTGHPVLPAVERLLDAGRGAEADAMLRDAIAREPANAELHLALGRLSIKSGRGEEAAYALRRALDLQPELGEAAFWLAGIARWTGHKSEAVELLRYAAAHSPRDAVVQLALGEALSEAGSHAEAVGAYTRCLEINPDQKLAHNNLSVALAAIGRVSLAIEHARAALRSDPDFGEAYCSLADGLRRAGCSDEADEVYRRAEARGVLKGLGVSNYLLSSNYQSGLGPAEIYARHAKLTVTSPPSAPRPRTERRPTPGSRLRIGYVSADFREHSVAYFLEPVLARHDREHFEIYCYYNYPSEDAVTLRMKSLADRWRCCHGMSDEELEALICADQIDVLVDLAGHSAWNRLQVFARTPAPVQATWLGYPTTTGLAAMDYRLTDWEVDPEGYEAYNAERPIRLRASYYCFRPHPDSPSVSASPPARIGTITFGCFNNLAKVSPAAIALWTRVLRALPNSRLLLKDRNLDDSEVRGLFADRFAKAGIGSERIAFRGWQPDPLRHLQAYAEVDIALDTYPYNGATTTCEALWMGVPVITLEGAAHASRMGASLLKAAGLGQFVATSEGEYVRLAVELGGKLDRLEELRHGMRDRLRTSALLDEMGFTRELESAYREMWAGVWEASSRAREPDQVERMTGAGGS
jgi:pentatricopeptide repeat protein